MESPHPNDRSSKIGVVTHGSLGQVEMKLDAGEAVEDVESGTFVVVQGAHYDFFSMITDVRIEASNENILLHPPGPEDELLRRVMQGMGTYATVELKPMLMMPNGEHPELADEEARSVKTVPAHFSVVAHAEEDDVARVFGHESHGDGTQYFGVGEPIGMEGIPVCLDLERFVERSNAVFGKTGTGKTFVTRLLLCGLIKTGRAANLVFDMHSEYGLGDRQEDGTFVKGLRDLFPSKVSIFSLDPESTRRRGASADVPVYLYADQIEPADVLPLKDTLNLTDASAETSYQIYKRYQKDWLRVLLEASGDEVEALAEECGAHPSSLSALKRKLNLFERYDFFRTDAPPQRRDVLEDLVENLQSRKSIVFEFGRYDDLRVYLLVANVITRRLRKRYEKLTNRYRQTKQDADKPTQLMITIEEAHKFLTPGVAHETPFGKIAREMRKYFVSLLVVDQRPSAIDEEVLSQIGTKLVAQLSDEKDIGAALVGTADAPALRKILATLDSKQQALLLGHAVPMPIVVRTRTYGEDFYQDLRDGRPAPAESIQESEKRMDKLFY